MSRKEESPAEFLEVCEEGGTILGFQVRAKLHQEQSPYQKIEVYESTHFGNLLVIDDFTMLSARDNFLYHEMLVHPAMFCHADPRRVAIIGGGDCGSLREVLRHEAVERVVQIDIDERVTRVCEEYFPELCEANDDPRAELLFIDGIRWMQQAEPGSLDLIIVDSTDPIGPGEVLFSESFYAACFRALGAGGILVQQSESPFLHQSILRRMRGDMGRAGFDQLQTLGFPQPVYTTGWWSATLAGRGVALDVFREQDARDKGFECKYYSADIHRAAMVLPPFVQQSLEARDQA